MASRTTQMTDKVLPPTDPRDLRGQERGGKVPLSISTSSTSKADSKADRQPRASQSAAASRSAQPPPPPRRTSDPPTTTSSSSSTSPYASPTRAVTTPQSAGFKDKGFWVVGAKSSTTRDPRRKSGSDVDATAQRRRSAHEWKTNVHTECGRHGDEWLFGGWKKMFIREEGGGGGEEE